MLKSVNLSEIQPLWQKFEAKVKYPFYSYRWHNSWWGTFAKDLQPLILLVNDRVIAPFVINKQTAEFSGGYEVADYLDLIEPENQFGQAWQYILEYLKKLTIKSINLRNIPQQSPTLEFFKSKTALSLFNNVSIIQEDTTPIVKLPSSWDSYLIILSRKHRHELRRKLRKFEREHRHITLEYCHNKDQDSNDLFELMRQNPNKDKFLTPKMHDFFRKILVEFPQDIFTACLRVDGKTVAVVFGFIWHSNLLLYNSGFDKEHFSGSSFYLKVKTIEYAIKKGFSKYNFLQGGERYKYELGGENFWVYKITAEW